MSNDELKPFAGSVSSIGDIVGQARPSRAEPKLRLAWLVEPLGRALRAMLLFLCHAMIMAVVMLAVFGVESLAHFLWADQQPLLFHLVPLSFLFDAAHLGVIGTFIYQGTREANAEFRGMRS